MKECKTGCDVESCFLCRLCLPDWLPAVATNRKNFEVKKGELIFKEGEDVKGIFFVYSGTVKVHKYWDGEKELIIRFAQPGDILGHLGLGNDPRYPVSTTALDKVTVCYLSMDFFESTLKVNNQLTYKLMRFFANQLQESEKRMRNFVHMPVKGRIAQAFLTLSDQFGTREDGTINVEITKQDISSFAGVSYETLFKVSNELVKAKLIEINGRHISILESNALRNIVEESNF